MISQAKYHAVNLSESVCYHMLEWKISTELKNLGLKVHLEPSKLIKSLINEEKGMILKASKEQITPLQLRN